MAELDTEVQDKEPSIRSMLESEFDKAEAPVTGNDGAGTGTDAPVNGEAPSTIKTETAEETEARKRGNPNKDPVTGKFTKSTEVAPKEAAPDKPITSQDNPVKPSDGASSPTIATAPTGWGAGARQAWSNIAGAMQTLPASIQADLAAIHAAAIKRDEDTSTGFRQMSETTRRYEQILSPVEQEAKRLGMDTPSALNALMGAHHALTRNPAQAIAKLAQDFGVEIQITGQASTPPAQIPSYQSDPRIETLWQAQQSQAAKDAAAMDHLVSEFMTDPSHEHFNEVETELMAMIPAIRQQKPYGTPREWLQEAYDRAVWANPNTRARLSNAQRATEDAKRIAEAKAKVGQARIAGSSVTGSTGSPSAPQRSSVREELEAAWNG